MSILLNGMKMPTSCRDCRFAGFGGIRCELYVCMFTGESQPILSQGRMSKCPLIEVPTPHGRLIDADALYNVFLGLAQDEWNRNTNCTWGAGFAEAMEMTEDAPTIIPADDPKGE